MGKFTVGEAARTLSPPGTPRGSGQPTLASHRLQEFLKQIVTIMRASRSLRVILHAKRRQLAVPDAFDRAVVEAAVRHFKRARQARFVDREAVVLAGDLDGARVKPLHRVIGAAVA